MKTNEEPDSPDNPPVLFVTSIIVGTFLFVFASWYIVEAMLSQVTNKVQADSVIGMGNKARLTYIQQEASYLQSSTKLDNGSYKIPIEQAMDKVIQKENSNQKESK
jgi:hypothetical protein